MSNIYGVNALQSTCSRHKGDARRARMVCVLLDAPREIERDRCSDGRRSRPHTIASGSHERIGCLLPSTLEFRFVYHPTFSV